MQLKLRFLSPLRLLACCNPCCHSFPSLFLKPPYLPVEQLHPFFGCFWFAKWLMGAVWRLFRHLHPIAYYSELSPRTWGEIPHFGCPFPVATPLLT